MSFFQRVATLATITLGISGLIGASTPGFAAQLDRTLNVPSSATVPTNDESSVLDATTIVSSVPVYTSQPDVTPDDDYASLSQAVAAQDAPDAMDQGLTCLAGAIYFEAKGEPLSGQLAVAKVIINRAKSGRFASSICSVVKQPGQFSFVRSGQIPAIANNADYRIAVAVAQVAMADRWDSPAASALYFHARRVTPGWHMTKVAAIGNHVFYR